MRKIGIEHEFFILDTRDRVPDKHVLTHFFHVLGRKGFKAFNPEKPFVLSRDVGEGYIAVSNDFCSHILEIAFPPVVDLVASEEMFLSVLEEIESCLSICGLSIKKGAYLSVEDRDLEFVQNEKFDWFNNRKFPQETYSERYPTAKIASTQFDIDILNADAFFNNLKYAYSFEYLLAHFYRAQSDKSRINRALVWRDSFQSEYLLHGYSLLEDVSSFEDYTKIKKTLPNLLRDYSFIAPRSEQRVEFRGSCSQESLRKIISLAQIRLIIVEMLENMDCQHLPIVTSQEFYSFCESGESNSEKLTRLLDSIITYIGDQELIGREELLRKQASGS